MRIEMKAGFERNWRHARRPGAAALELALLLPFLALMFSAAVDFSRIFVATQTLERAANTGAMYASGGLWIPTSQTTTTDAAITAVCSEGASLNPPLDDSNVAVSTNGTAITVTVTYNYPLLTAVLIPSATVALQRTVVMQIAPVAGN
jgi:Flp pilus assembly protein TadG